MACGLDNIPIVVREITEKLEKYQDEKERERLEKIDERRIPIKSLFMSKNIEV